MKIALFLTYGISVHKWFKMGLLTRESFYYNELGKRGNEITFITYGNESDYEYKSITKNIEIFPMFQQSKIPKNKVIFFFKNIFCVLQSLEYYKSFDIYKSNQMLGSWIPLLVSKLTRKPFVIRCGFEQYFTYQKQKRNKLFLSAFYLYSKLVYTKSDKIIVTTKKIKEDIHSIFKIEQEKIEVIPNYIATDRFTVKYSDDAKNRVIYIGRLSEEKNISRLIRACHEVNLTLTIVGSGPLEDELKRYAKNLNSSTNFLGQIDNDKLVEEINKNEIFALLSDYEGNPKSLLEAMSCGLIVIGTDVTGINSIIQNRINGYIVNNNLSDTVKVLKEIIRNPNNSLIKSKARRFTQDNYSTDFIIEAELNVLRNTKFKTGEVV